MPVRNAGFCCLYRDKSVILQLWSSPLPIWLRQYRSQTAVIVNFTHGSGLYAACSFKSTASQQFRCHLKMANKTLLCVLCEMWISATAACFSCTQAFIFCPVWSAAPCRFDILFQCRAEVTRISVFLVWILYFLSQQIQTATGQCKCLLALKIKPNDCWATCGLFFCLVIEKVLVFCFICIYVISSTVYVYVY